jgi:hypothetical protein
MLPALGGRCAPSGGSVGAVAGVPSVATCRSNQLALASDYGLIAKLHRHLTIETEKISYLCSCKWGGGPAAAGIKCSMIEYWPLVCSPSVSADSTSYPSANKPGTVSTLATNPGS